MDKPIVQLSGEDGNTLAIVGRCRRALRRVGQEAQADKMAERVWAAGSYDEALQIVMEYVHEK